MADDREVRRLGREILDLNRKVHGLSTSARLVNATLEDGSINERDRDGGLVSIIGKQPDGTHGVVRYDGPIPPVPAAPSVEGGAASVTAVWGGTYVDGVGPMDFRGVEVYAAPGPFEHIEDAELVGIIPDPDGGRVTVARTVGTWHLGLVTLSDAGKRSAVSALATAEASSVLDSEAMAELEQQLADLDVDLDVLREADLPALVAAMATLNDTTLPALSTSIGDAHTALDAAFPSGAFNVQAGIDGKGETIFQISAPTGSRARPENLWVRKPDMKVHVYDVDQAQWVPATDPDIIAAASAAAQAQADAATAVTAANGKNKVTYTSTSAAPGSAPANDFTRTVGDIHRNRLISNGTIVAEWYWNGANWVAATYGDEILTSLDVGKITAGMGVFQTAVIELLAVEIATIIELNADRINAGEISTARLNAEAVAAAVGTFLSLRADQITAVGAGFDTAVINELRAKLLVAQKILAGEIDTASLAADEAFIALLRAAVLIVGAVPPSALAVGVEELIPDPMWAHPDQHDVPQGTGYRWSTSTVYREAGQARTLWLAAGGLTLASRLYLTAAPIPVHPGERFMLALRARRTAGVLAPAIGLEVRDAAGAKLGDVAVAASGSQATGSMVTTDGVVVIPDGGFQVVPWIGVDPAGSEPSTGTWYVSRVSMRGVQASTTQQGYTTQVTGRGLETLTPEGEPMTQLGAFDQTGLRLLSTSGDNAGDATVVISDDGSGAFVELAAQRILYGGVELTELLGLDIDAEEEAWDEPRPRGILGVRTFADNRGPWTALTGVGYVGWIATPGRMYKITASGRVRNIATGAGVQVELRGLHSGSPGAGYPGPPSVSWPEVGLSTVVPAHKDSDSRWVGFEKSWYWTPDPQGTVLKPARMLLCLTPPEGGNVAWAAGGTLAVEDVGLVPATASGWHMGGSTGGGGGDSTPAPADPTPTKTRKTSPFGRSWLKSWEEGGASPNAIAGKAMQGYTRFYPSAGIYRSMIGFNSMTGTLSPVLTADIEKIEVEIKNGYGYATTFVVGVHGATSEPSSFSRETSHGTVSVTIGGGKSGRVVLPSSTHAGFKNGTLRGITLHAPDTGSQYYGYTSQATARVTYRS